MLGYPVISNYIDSFTSNHSVANVIRPRDKEAFNRFYALMSRIRITGTDDLRSVFVRFPRGEEPGMDELKEAVDYGGYESVDDCLSEWRSLNSEAERWYEVDTIAHSNGYRALFFNNRVVLQCDERENPIPDGFIPWDEDAIPAFLDSLYDALTESIRMLEAGTYNDFVKDNIPYVKRQGVIRRSTLWELFPAARENFLEGLTDKEIAELDDAVSRGEHKRENVGRLSTMTSGLFFRMCAAGYDAVDAVKYAGENPRARYVRWADGRDEGLRDIPEDDAEAFMAWYHGKRFGGHPWEVIRGGNSTHVDLFVSDDDDGWYFAVAGKHRIMEAVRFFLAIRKEGMPVTLIDGEKILRAVKGEDFIGIVPEGVFPRYCEGRFKGVPVLDFMNLWPDDTENEEFMKAVRWEEPATVELVSP